MVIASHIIITTYGFWLPNDPRGSWSDFVRSWELYWYGDATGTNERRSLAHDAHDQQLRQAQKLGLRYHPVIFNGAQAQQVAFGFRRAVEESGYRVYACSILPQHDHLVISRHERAAERIAGHLKTRATQALIQAKMHPFAQYADADGRLPCCWSGSSWKVFLDDAEAVDKAVRYVEENPVKEGKRAQKWSFVQRHASQV